MEGQSREWADAQNPQPRQTNPAWRASNWLFSNLWDKLSKKEQGKKKKTIIISINYELGILAVTWCLLTYIYNNPMNYSVFRKRVKEIYHTASEHIL
jgi:hypothetical protein